MRTAAALRRTHRHECGRFLAPTRSSILVFTPLVSELLVILPQTLRACLKESKAVTRRQTARLFARSTNFGQNLFHETICWTLELLFCGCSIPGMHSGIRSDIREDNYRCRA